MITIYNHLLQLYSRYPNKYTAFIKGALWNILWQFTCINHFFMAICEGIVMLHEQGDL